MGELVPGEVAFTIAELVEPGAEQTQRTVELDARFEPVAGLGFEAPHGGFPRVHGDGVHRQAEVGHHPDLLVGPVGVEGVPVEEPAPVGRRRAQRELDVARELRLEVADALAEDGDGLPAGPVAPLPADRGGQRIAPVASDGRLRQEGPVGRVQFLRRAAFGRELREGRVGDDSLAVQRLAALVVVAGAEGEGPGVRETQIELAEEGGVPGLFLGVEERGQHETRRQARQFPRARRVRAQRVGQVGEVEAEDAAADARSRVAKQELLGHPLVVGGVLEDTGGSRRLVEILGAPVVVLVDAGGGLQRERVAQVVGERQRQVVVLRAVLGGVVRDVHPLFREPVHVDRPVAAPALGGLVGEQSPEPGARIETQLHADRQGVAVVVGVLAAGGVLHEAVALPVVHREAEGGLAGHDRDVQDGRAVGGAEVAEPAPHPERGPVLGVRALHDDGAGQRVAALLGGLGAAEDLDPVHVPGAEGTEEGSLVALDGGAVQLDAQQHAALRPESLLADAPDREAADVGGGVHVRGHGDQPVEVGVGPGVELGAAYERDTRRFVLETPFLLLPGNGHAFREGHLEGDADTDLAGAPHGDLDGPVGEAAAEHGQPMQPLGEGVEAETAGGVAGGFADLAAREGEDHVGAGDEEPLRIGDFADELGGGRRDAGRGRRRGQCAMRKSEEAQGSESEHGGNLSRDDYARSGPEDPLPMQ